VLGRVAFLISTIWITSAPPLLAQDRLEQTFQRYVELWEVLVADLGDASPTACSNGAVSARAWADEHLREVVELEKRLADASEADDPPTGVDSTEADVLGERFFELLERWMDWGFACVESEPAIEAGRYIEERRAKLEFEIFGAPQTVAGQFESDLAALDDPAFQAEMAVADGERLAQSGNIEMAIEAFRQAGTIDSTFDVAGESWNELCWFGSLWEQAAQVLFACDLAVERSGGIAWIIDSRGLARAMTGNVEGAIADFVTYIESRDATQADIDEREAWIRALRAGENPFTEELLARLRAP
jgi:hypothetical protein